MQRHIQHWYSPNLHKDMGIVSYGHWGFPLLMFPTAAADFLEYERFLLMDVLEPYIEGGKVRIFSIDSINSESWLNKKVHPKWKGIRQQQYNSYITEEVVPYIWHQLGGRTGIITAGASLGAFHCANQLFRRPDLFAGCIAMSGCYDIRDYYESYGYHDENIFFNNVAEYLPGLHGAPLHMLQHKRHIHVLTGQGAYENADASRWLSAVLSQKGIPHNLDVWGYDMRHDWPTWRDMMRHYLGAHF